MRTYADFGQRSSIPDRGDGKTHAPRNSPALVNATLDRPGGMLLHFDAEFNSTEDLVAGTFTGRNFGWLPGERAEAIAHIANVVRGDDGSFDPSGQFDALSYRILFGGRHSSIPDGLRLPPEFRAFVTTASDQEIFDAVIKVVVAYVNGLQFSQAEDSGAPIRSPFDVFLEINGLPQGPDPGESPIDYSRRLRTLVNAPGFSPHFVTSNPNRADGQFQFHSQPFQFGATELEGMKMFLTEAAAPIASLGEISAGKIGNCIACLPRRALPISSSTIRERRRRNTTASPATALAHSPRWPYRHWPHGRRTIFRPAKRIQRAASGSVPFRRTPRRSPI